MQTQTRPHRYAEVDISGKVRGVAAEKRVSQARIAEAINTSKMAVTRRMNGSVEWSARDLAVLADYFGVPVERFYGDHS